MSSIDQQFVEFIVKSLVSKPDAVQVERRIDEKGVLLELTVDPEDLGRVIGKRGATAQSLRTLLRALGTKNDARYNLKIVDNGVPGGAANADDTGSDDSYADEPVTGAQAVDASADDLNDRAAVETETDVPPRREAEEDRVSKARKELAELDDLDV